MYDLNVLVHHYIHGVLLIFMSHCHNKDINWALYVKLHLLLRLAKCKVISNMIFESIPLLNKSWRIIRKGNRNEGLEKEPSNSYAPSVFVRSLVEMAKQWLFVLDSPSLFHRKRKQFEYATKKTKKQKH